MQVYPGTAKARLSQITEEGVGAPSYWTDDYEHAKEYAASHGEGVVLCVELADNEFKANMLVAGCLLEDGSISSMPDEDVLAFSLANLEGIVCRDCIRTFEVRD